MTNRTLPSNEVSEILREVSTLDCFYTGASCPADCQCLSARASRAINSPSHETLPRLTVEIPAVACIQCGSHVFVCAACGPTVKGERFGPTEPDNAMVICPACTSQFVAVPVSVQAKLSAAEAALVEADRRYRSRHGNLMYADVLYALAGDSISGTEHALKASAFQVCLKAAPRQCIRPAGHDGDCDVIARPASAR